MDEGDIISFEQYRKKKYGNQYEKNTLSEILNRDLREQTDLLDWLSFHSSLNKYKLFVHMLFRQNHNPNNRNPNAGYLIAYSPEHIERHVGSLLEALDWESRQYILVKAAGRTFREMGEDLYGYKPKTQVEVFDLFKQTLLTTNKVIVIQEVSESRIGRSKSAYARSLIKMSDDAHFDGIHPQSDLIFVDYADFLQKSWQHIGSYLEILT